LLSLRCQIAVWLVLAASLAACGGRSQPQLEVPVTVTPADTTPVVPPPPPEPPNPFADIPASPISLASLSGQKVLLIHVGAVIAADSLLSRDSSREIAYGALDSVIARQNTGVEIVTLAEQRRSVRRNPAVAVNPDRIPVEMLAEAGADRLPQGAVIQLRGLAALTGTRLALIPALAHVVALPAGGYRATYVMVMADTRSAAVMARLRATANGSSPLEALQAAAAQVVSGSPN